MRIVQVGAALAALGLVGSVGAAGHIVDIAWSAEGRFAHRARIATGKFVEVCGRLGAGDTVNWSFEASAPVDFNIHYHVGKDAVFPARQAQVGAGRDALKVALAQDYCWMWSNKAGETVTLSVELAR